MRSGKELGFTIKRFSAAWSGRWAMGRWRRSRIGHGRVKNQWSRSRTWSVSLACDKAKEHGYPHELWTTRLLARHRTRSTARAAGRECFAKLVQGTVCKILGQGDINRTKVRCSGTSDVRVQQKMAEVLCVYRKSQVLEQADGKP